MSTQAEAETKLGKLINAAQEVAGEGEHPHKLVWDLISARELQAHAHCSNRGCSGFVFIKIVAPPVYEGSAIKTACPVH
jgi:hypothetical protein